jgi:coenzyme F420-dependent glucose-6-phosphate dehydrogenase
MRLLWQGGMQTHYGEHYVVENARVYDLPAEPVKVMIAASASRAATLAGRVGDGLIGTSPRKETVASFDEAGGQGKPRYGQVTLCWAEDESEAVRTAHRLWPTSAMPGQLSQELALPAHFEQAAQLVTEEAIAGEIPCGPDPARILDAIRQYEDAGYTHIYLHQIGPQQDAFLRFCRREILPALAPAAAARS